MASIHDSLMGRFLAGQNVGGLMVVRLQCCLGHAGPALGRSKLYLGGKTTVLGGPAPSSIWVTPGLSQASPVIPSNCTGNNTATARQPLSNGAGNRRTTAQQPPSNSVSNRPGNCGTTPLATAQETAPQLLGNLLATALTTSLQQLDNNLATAPVTAGQLLDNPVATAPAVA